MATLLVNGKIEAEWDGRYGTCAGCRAKIRWVVYKKTWKRTPVDLDPNATSHFATCPNAKNFREPKGPR